MLVITTNNIKKEIKNFKFYEKLDEKFEGIVHSKDNCFPTDEAITKAMECAWKDLMMRTLTNKVSNERFEKEKSDQEKSFDKFTKLKGFVSLQEMVRDNFNEKYDGHNKQKEQDNFDESHHEVCLKVLRSLKYQYKNKVVNYGKAQKLVNMTFKYLYCILDEKERMNYEKYFKYCHMPLDSIMLEWIKREMLINPKGKDFPAGEIPKWSNLEFSSKDKYIQNGQYTYKAFVDLSRFLIPEKTKEGDYLTPLTAEVVIWPKMRLKLAAEAFLNQLRAIEGKGEKKEKVPLDEKSLKNDLESIKEKIENY